MQRRRFLRLFLGGGCLLPAAAAAYDKPLPAVGLGHFYAPPEHCRIGVEVDPACTGPGGSGVTTRMLIQHSPVAGFQYHDGESVWPLLQKDQPLELQREPANRHDVRAVAVYWQQRKLGYVPRVENTAIAQMLDRGEWLHSRITRLRDDPDPWRRVQFCVWCDVL